MAANAIVLVFVLLFVKHFIFDFLLQGPFMYLNKGKYGHLGGIEHAAHHGLGTFMALSFFVAPVPALLLAATDAVVHYHVDWVKVQLNKRFDLKPNNSEWYWVLLGADQLLHLLTYAAIVLAII